LTVTPKPAASVGPNLIPTNVISHSWTLSKISNITGDTLIIPQYNQPKVVEVRSLWWGRFDSCLQQQHWCGHHVQIQVLGGLKEMTGTALHNSATIAPQ